MVLQLSSNQRILTLAIQTQTTSNKANNMIGMERYPSRVGDWDFVHVQQHNFVFEAKAKPRKANAMVLFFLLLALKTLLIWDIIFSNILPLRTHRI